MNAGLTYTVKHIQKGLTLLPSDWEYVSVDYFAAKADMYVAGEALVVERITVYWQVKMRKWVDE